MRFKNWLPGKSKKPSVEAELTVDELMALERHDEAKARLVSRLKTHPNDLHAHLKLGDVYRHLGQADSCQSEYLHVAAAYAEDGFYDRARAVLTKVSRFFPGEIDVESRMSKLERAKSLEYSRDKAREGLLAGRNLSDSTTGVEAIEFERVWTVLSQTSLVDRLSNQDLMRLFETVRILRLPPGSVVADPAEETSPRALFVIVSGRVEARALDRNDHLVSLRSFGSGETIGASVLFGGEDWAAQYRSPEASILLELGPAGAERLAAAPGESGLLAVLRDPSNDTIVRRAVDHLRR